MKEIIQLVIIIINNIKEVLEQSINLTK